MAIVSVSAEKEKEFREDVVGELTRLGNWHEESYEILKGIERNLGRIATSLEELEKRN